VGWLTNAARAVSDPGADRIRRVLVGFEVALCTALLAVAGLLLHSFVNVLGVDAGFAVERVLAIDLSLPRRQYANPQTAAFYRELIERVRAQPGVAAAGAVSLLPIAHEGVIGPVLLESDTRHRLDRPAALRRSVTPDLFSAMDIPLLAGRVFHDQEPALAVIASESLATRLWPGEPLHAVVGRGVRTDPANPLMTVVGVVGDIRADALDRAAPTVMYQHYRQDVRRGMTLVVRTARDPLTLAAAVRAQVSALDPSLPIVAIRTMAEIVDASVAERRFQMTLVVLFALLALGLAVVGIYGVTSYSVARRTQEIGLRVALGAGRAEVLRSVLADGLKPVAIGAALGMAAGQFGAMSIRSVLFGIGTLDPIALLGVTSLLVVTAALACFLPARAAAALDPVRALRSD
jgi:predicted permease